MASIGQADLIIVPKFNNLTDQVNNALGNASSTASSAGEKLGKSTGSGFGKGLGTSGAAIGVFSAVTSKAMDAITSHVSSAISRFDTLNNYPKTMENLGFSSESAEASINKMSDRLSSLPTTLDSMAGTVQGLAVITEDLDKATDAGLALNDMLIAGGGSTAQVTAAAEQFRQILSKGKPEMQDWKSLMQAAPGQMKQLAQEMLGATATTDDLYAALGGGGAEATVSIDELLDAMIRLDTEGGASFASFQEQAETAAGGVATSAANAGNAITKGLAGTLDSIGKDTISGVFNDLKTGINDAFKTVNGVIKSAMPAVKQLYQVFKDIGPTVGIAVAGFAGLSKIASLVGPTTKFASVLGDVGTAFGLVTSGQATLTQGLGLLLSGINPVTVALGALAAVAAVAYTTWADATEKQENYTAATQGLADAVNRSDGLSSYAGKIENVGTVAGTTAMSVDDLNESIANSVDTMNANIEQAETTIATLNTAQQILDDSIGKTDLSTAAQGRLEWALSTLNEQLGTTITQEDVLNGTYTDQDGNVQNLKQSIDELIASKKEEARVSAITANLTEAYQNQSDAAASLTQAQKDYNDALSDFIASGGSEAHFKATSQGKELKEAVDGAREAYDNCTSSVSSLEQQLGDTISAQDEAASSTEKWAAANALVSEGLSTTGQSISNFATDLDALGVSTSDLEGNTDLLVALTSTYDGTVGSLATTLSEYGFSVDNATVKTAAMADTLNGFDIAGTFEAMGSNTSDFAQALSDAGVETSTLQQLGSSNFAALAQACNNDTATMISALQALNDQDLEDKNVTVSAGGNAVDGTAYVNIGNTAYQIRQMPDGTVSVNAWGNAIDGTASLSVQGATRSIGSMSSKTVVAQATGNAADGTGRSAIAGTTRATNSMQSKSVTATVNGNAANGSAASSIWNTVRSISSLVSRKVTTTVTNIVNTITGNKEAAGGIRTHADGGIRKHAGGAIVNVPGTGYPLDWVGEDGAEAIVPLTNKRYSLPFAKTLAEQMGAINTGNATTTNIYIDSSLLEMDNYTSDAVRSLTRALRSSARMA